MKPSVFCLLGVLWLCLPLQGQAHELDTGDSKAPQLAPLSLLYDEEEILISATDSARTLDRAPAIASVITAKQIRAMGARNLLDALDTIPGFGVSYANPIAVIQSLEVRGLKTDGTEKVLLMINGQRVNHPFLGAWTFMFDEFPLDGVRRIEVIRGPGSALYGADAFVAVINVITEAPDAAEGTAVALRAGNTERVEQAVKLGHQEGDFAMVANYHHLDTNGSSEFIPQDAVGNSGTTNFWRNNHTGYARARYRNLEISALQVHKRRGTPLGITGNVDNRSDLDMTQTLGQVSYKGEVRRLKTEFRVGVNEMDWSNTWQLDIPGFGNTGNPKAKSRATDVSYRVWAPDISGHHLAAGLVFEHLQEFDVRHILDGVDVSSFLNHNQDVTRNIYALYLQDDWEINSKDTVTAGARWDHYSDFGSTINPRLAYVHSHSSDVKMKLLLARAFRAPSFIELYEINNPAGVGNPNLKAETMRTLEAGIEWRLNHWSRLSSNLFLNQFRNRITRQAPLSVNEGGADIWGFETELKADWREMRHGYLNWSWIHGEDHDTGTRLADVPHHRVKAGINWGLLKNRLNGNLGLFWAGRQLRPIGDSRPPTKAHTVIDLAVSTPSRPDGFDWALTVHNVQNKLFSDPSLPSIPGGVPRPGRTWLVEVRYKY